MAKTKSELLKEAKAAGVEVTEKNTVAEITAAIAAISQTPVEPVEKGDLDVAKEGQKQEAAAAKSGKRSAKGQHESDEKQAKIEAQKHRENDAKKTEDTKPKQPEKPARSKLERRGKNFRKAAEKVDKNKAYSLEEASKLAATTSPVKFDATVELHVRLNVDPRQADQNIRGNVILPEGTGKQVRVAVFSDDKAEGADISGVESITKDLEKGTINFDVLVSSPANMPKLGKYARLLGPRGLMPNPKSGTVTTDLTKAVSEAKAGRVEFRVDSTGIIHLGVGKVSFGDARLAKNIQAVFASIKASKPHSQKGTYVNNIYLTTSMGPSIPVEPNL